MLDLLESCGSYLWGMKKHMAADETAWNDMAKRVQKLKNDVSSTLYF